ncbi:hypothetical protein P1J78_14965 [Psychromarinibacter sp. C21-152]|uniref:Tetratricopeptide repeat-containing protein n=1 Tax=Psychromarinibacter sediminicola TaxID=3033385 RepID=A0AAE3NU44_9RHOB|nr:hypothetical protein [Psychromarinibacter sediminicola]MDF0602041.1 hypothetical protein [Psychromarinibacter sediminicola]
MRTLLLSAALILPAAAFAASSDDSSEPATTETTTECTDGMVWSDDAQACVAPEDSSMNDDRRYRAVRELAHAGRYDDALRVLAAMSDPQDDRVLTYLGFIHRQQGETELGFAYYRKAIAANPDNLLARSYMGQGFVDEGRLQEAYAQLVEIRTRGGAGGWPEVALRRAIETGVTTSY